jgi:hypothetical protein
VALNTITLTLTRILLVISKSVVELEVKIALYGHKTFEYEFCTCTPKLPNQNTGDIV